MRPARGFLEWVLASGFLILAVVLLRAVFGRRMGAGLRYALWGVVLLRLLVPVQFFTVPVPAAVRQTDLSRPVAVGALPAPAPAVPGNAAPPSGEAAVNIDAIPAPEQSKAFTLHIGEVLGWLWLAGAVAAMGILAVSNLSFARRLRRVRVPLDGRSPVSACGAASPFQKGPFAPPERISNTALKAPFGQGAGDLPVYLAENLPSPCLFGLFRPAVYVTPAAAADPAVLRHVLAHEYTHFRHGDHIWNVLRGVALAVHWWDPLVWLAAALSRRDSELACDEGALRRLGEEERFAYGRTLLTLVTSQPRPADLLSCATTMTGGGRSVAQRVKRIAHAPKRWLWAAAAAVLLAALVTVCAFGQAEGKTPELWPDGVVTRTYTRDKGGFPDEFVIRLHKDGTFSYYEGGYSSFIGMGTWTQEGDVICLADESNENNLMYHYFTLEEDALVFRAGESTRFIYVDVADGERFSLDPDPAKRDWFDGRPLHFSVPEGDGSAGVLISGLENMRVTWSADTSPSKGLLNFNGDLGAFCPSLAGKTASPGSAIWTDESRTAVSVVMNVGSGTDTEAAGEFYVHFVAEPDSGTVSKRTYEANAAGETLELTGEEMADMARILAHLLTAAEEYSTGAAAPAPEETPSLTPVYSVNEEANALEITGLDCDWAAWQHANGWVFRSPFDQSEAIETSYKQMGLFHANNPRFLGGLFSDMPGELMAVYTPNGDSPWIYLLYGDLRYDADTDFVVEARVDLAAGTVTEKHARDAEGREMEVDSGQLLDAARTLAGLIQGAAEYWDKTAPAEPPADPSTAQPEFCYQYYADGSLPLFEVAFSRLDNIAVQSGMLNKLYSDGDTAFFSAAVRGLDENSPLLDGLAEQAYADGEIAFFSILADRMDKEEWGSWLDRALADGKWDFQSMLSDRLDMDKEKDAQEEEWERQQIAEYQAVGVTMDGKNYYYQGQLVNIFLDVRANGSFYTLDNNPAGTVNIKILRGGDNKVTGAAYMTEAEVAELLRDMNGPDDG